MKVFVAGAGKMGAGIAQVFAMYDYDVLLFEINVDLVQKGYLTIDSRLQKLVQEKS